MQRRYIANFSMQNQSVELAKTLVLQCQIGLLRHVQGRWKAVGLARLTCFKILNAFSCSANPKDPRCQNSVWDMAEVRFDMSKSVQMGFVKPERNN